MKRRSLERSAISAEGGGAMWRSATIWAIALGAALMVHACSTATRQDAESPARNSGIYKMGARVETGGLAITVDAISDSPSPGTIPAAHGQMAFAVHLALKVGGQTENITFDRFSVRSESGYAAPGITDLVAVSISPLGRLNSGAERSGWIGFSVPASDRPNVLVYRSKRGEDFVISLEPGKDHKSATPQVVAPPATQVSPTSGSSSKSR